MKLNRQLADIAHSRAINFFGVADLSPVYDTVLAQGGKFVAGFPFSISIGISLLDSIVALLPQRDEKTVKLSYQHHAYDIVNLRLDLAASHISGYLQQLGFSAFPIPAAKYVDDERLCAAFSHKLGAHLAGLGWIGRSCLLITPQNGPRARWTTVLTDAPLKATGGQKEVQCGDCRACVDICPVRAFTGRPFKKEEPREARYEARKCEEYLQSLEKKDGMAVCGLCLYVCPYGKKRNEV